MSDIDLKALETHFNNWRTDRAPKLERSRAFERFAVDQILKNLDPSDEELDAGDLGGADDGGVDAMHLIMNNTMLVLDESNVPAPTTSVELVLVQAKLERGFSEMAVQKIQSFCDNLLDYSALPDSFTFLNSDVRDAMKRFRAKYDAVIGQPHSIKVTIHYATKATHVPKPTDKVIKRVEALKAFILSRLSQANVGFEFWGCSRLLASAREIPKQERVLAIRKYLSDDDGSVICLTELKAFANFLTDENGLLRTAMLEPNVRDYQGKRNPVNNEIRQTLNDDNALEEFWWLNNGITILVTNCSVAGNKLTMTAPEIVNGLQTSNEVFAAFAKGAHTESDQRTILVRVIVSSNDRSRNKVIKATNFQTPVEQLSLRATDRIHFDIEDRLKLYQLYYDRKKGKYRRLNKPISDIVAMRTLSQAVMAIWLQRPDDARARPQSLLRDEKAYNQLFDEGHNRDLYPACIMVDRAVKEYVESMQIDRDEKRDIRYCVDTLVACELTGVAKPSVDSLAGMVTTCTTGIPLETLLKCADTVLREYRDLGGNETVAKSKGLWAKVASMSKPTAESNGEGS